MKNCDKSVLHQVAFWLLIIGGFNWGFVGLFNLDLVKAIFGSVPWLSGLIYLFVGIAAIDMLVVHYKLGCCKFCAPSSKK